MKRLALLSLFASACNDGSNHPPPETETATDTDTDTETGTTAPCPREPCYYADDYDQDADGTVGHSELTTALDDMRDGGVGGTLVFSGRTYTIDQALVIDFEEDQREDPDSDAQASGCTVAGTPLLRWTLPLVMTVLMGRRRRSAER